MINTLQFLDTDTYKNVPSSLCVKEGVRLDLSTVAPVRCKFCYTQHQYHVLSFQLIDTTETIVISRMLLLTSVVLMLPLLSRTERSRVRWSHYSHQLPGRGSMMSVSRLYPAHSLQYNETLRDEESTPGPFAPRFRVPRWEISDEEWSREIEEGFAHTGIVPQILPRPPPGLININFDLHSCTHMGNVLSASATTQQPKLSWPTERGRMYSLVMLETDSMSLHWLKVNIAQSDMLTGDTLVPFHPPAASGQFLVVALLQSGVLATDLYPVTSCLHRIHFRRMIQVLRSELVAAANYWRQQAPTDHRRSYQVCPTRG